MKINYRTYPVLKQIEESEFGFEFPTFNEDSKFWDSNFLDFRDSFNKFSGLCKNNINIISIPFYEAAFKAYPKLDSLLHDILNDDNINFDISGVYVMPQMVTMIDFHKFKNNSYFILFSFLKSGQPVVWSMANEINGNTNDGFSWASFNITPNESEYNAIALVSFRWAIILDMFKSYAEVETKYLEPNSKIKEINCKYINETKLGVTYLDSKWFTNLIKTDSFKVRGHFRLQPKKKDGKWTHELIWINDFIKTGYTSPARKLNLC